MAINVGDITAVFRVVDQASADLAKISAELKQTESGFGTMQTAMTAVTVTAAAVVAGMAAIGAAVVKIGEHGAAVGDISEQFDKLATKAGVDATQALDALREATAGTLSDFELMKSALPLLSSGFKGSASDLRTMAEAARVLAERGMSMTDALGMVSSAMTTGRTRALSMQGVVVDMQGALKSLKTATDEEGDAVENSASLHVKQQEILKGLRGLVQENGAVMDDFADKTDRVRVKFANFYNEFAKRIAESEGLNQAFDRIGTAIAKAFGGDQEKALDTFMRGFEAVMKVVGDVGVAAVEGIAEAFAWLRRAIDGASQSGALTALASALTAVWDVLKLVWSGLKLAAEMMLYFGDQLKISDAIVTAFKSITTAIGWVSTAVTWAADKIELVLFALNRLRGVDPGLPKVTGGFADLNTRGFQPVISATDALAGKLGPLTQGIGKAGEATRLTAEQLKKLKEAEDAMSGAKVVADLKDQIATYDRLVAQGLTPTLEAQKALHLAVEKAIAITLEAGRQIPPEWEKIRAATQAAANGMDRWSSENEVVAQSLLKVWEIGQDVSELTPPDYSSFLPDFRETWQKIADSLKDVPDMLSNGLGEAMDEVPPMLKKKGAEGAVSWADGFKDIAKGFGNLIVSAFTGSGDWMNALGALGSQVGQLIGSKLGSALKGIGGMFGTVLADILPGLGSLLGPTIEWIGNALFKVEGRKVNDLRDAYVAAAGGIDALNAAAQRAGMGINALDQLLRADTVEEYNAAIAELDKRLKALADAAAEFGLTWRDLTGEGLTAGFQKEADTLLEKFNLLIGGGYDVGKVVAAMADQLNALLIDAVQTGQQLPAAMQPMIDKLVEMGLLSDEARAALLGLANDTVAATSKATEAMRAQFDALGKEYDSLAQSIANEAPEEVMGVVEAQTRARMDAIKREQDALAAAMGNAEDQAKASAQALADALKNIFKDPIKIQIDWQMGEMPDMPDIPAVTIPINYSAPTVPGTTYAGGEAPEEVPGWNELYGIPSYAEGGIGNFGAGTLAMLHGTEAIVPLSGGTAAATFSDSRMVSELQALRADNLALRESLNAMPRTLSRAMRDVVLMTR